MRSIRVRLLGLIGLLLLAVLASFGYVAWHRENTARIAAIDRELEERLNLLVSSFRPIAGQRLQDVSEPRLSARARELFANEGGDPFYYQAWLADGRLQARSEHAPEMERPAQKTEAKTKRMRGEFREMAAFTPTGRCFVVGRSIQQDRTAMRRDALSLAAIGAGVLLAGLTLAWWIASRVTRPLAEVSRTAKQIAAGDLSRRIQLTETGDELGDVTKVLNDTFARLEAAFVRQKQFTADASHELRTPVSLILTHAQGALLREQSPADYREALADCAQAAQRMKALIESLLDLARFDAGAKKIYREPCDLAQLARDCATQLQPLVEAKRLRLDLDLQPAPCNADPLRIAQVITNLLANAVHFTPPEGKIALHTNNRDGARFSIRDDGPGIAPDQQAHLFERFHRADSSRNRATGGTGLGLAICKAIMDAHGGEISVESTTGRGSTFTIFLPPADSQVPR
ncbi:MAG: HAMP domain-containing histidine kinase [Lacunisphaera sp.]|nr:HAMP domain-containing histidine kinase [Lacunisphaera sp.]